MNRVIPCLLVLVAAPLALLMPEPTFAALQLPMTLHPDYPRIELPFAPQPVPATLPASPTLRPRTPSPAWLNADLQRSESRYEPTSQSNPFGRDVVVTFWHTGEVEIKPWKPEPPPPWEISGPNVYQGTGLHNDPVRLDNEHFSSFPPFEGWPKLRIEVWAQDPSLPAVKTFDVVPSENEIVIFANFSETPMGDWGRLVDTRAYTVSMVIKLAPNPLGTWLLTPPVLRDPRQVFQDASREIIEDAMKPEPPVVIQNLNYVF